MKPGNDFIGPDPKHLEVLANYKMPFGKYKGKLLVHIPEPYYVWFKQKGFPKGKLGNMLQEMYEIKVNGLESMLQPLINSKHKF